MSKSQLSRLIDLPDDALQQVLDYAATLSKVDAADHFANLLGDSPAAIEFVADFNSRRHDPAEGSASAVAATPAVGASTGAAGGSGSGSLEPAARAARPKKKKKAALHTPPPRQVASLAPPPGAAYNKKDVEEDYMSGRSGTSAPAATTTTATTTTTAATATAMTTPPSQTAQPSQKNQQQQQPPPRRPAAGSLVQDALAPKSSRKTGGGGSGASVKVRITGGTAMHGAASGLADFDAAIRALEISTNPTLAPDGREDAASRAARRCNCVATRHPLQTAAPNCLACGKVICVKEGLGPCTACGTPLLAPADVQAMIRELRVERGREKMAADREAHQRPGTTGTGSGAAHPRMIAGSTKWGGDDDGFVSLAEAAAHNSGNTNTSSTGAAAADAQLAEAAAKARAHRDKLLAFQADNAQRTTIRDEAADFDFDDALVVAAQGQGDGDADAGGAGGYLGRNLWATPEERARALRRQQRRLREMEWNARPEYEKRQEVLSIDVSGKKVFRRIVPVQRPPTPESEDDDNDYDGDGDGDGNRNGGAFSKNPLLGKLIKPVYDARGRAAAQRAQDESKAEDKSNGKGNGKGRGKGKGKGKDSGTDRVTVEAETEADDGAGSDAPLPGRRDDPNAAHRWRRVQDDLDDNEDVILDGGLFGRAPAANQAVGDEPSCG